MVVVGAWCELLKGHLLKAPDEAIRIVESVNSAILCGGTSLNEEDWHIVQVLQIDPLY
jgi:hypothetical protein